MKRNLRFLFSTLLMLVCSVVGMAATGDTYKLITDASELQSGDIVVMVAKAQGVAMGAPNSGKTKYDPVSGLTFSDEVFLSYKDGFTEMTLEGEPGKWYFKYDNGYIYVKNVTDTSLAFDTNKNKSAKIDIASNGNATIAFDFAANTKYFSYSTDKKNFGYYNTYTGWGGDKGVAVQLYKKQRRANGISVLSNPTTWTLNTGTQALPIYNPNKLQLTYTSSNPYVATVDADGNATLKTWGTTTITATYAGDAVYEQGTVSLVLNVTEDKADYTRRTIDFVAGVDKGNRTSTGGFDSMEKDVVNVHANNAAFASNPYQLKSGKATDVEVAKGNIVMVEIEGNLDNVSQGDNGGGTYDKLSSSRHIWTGAAKKVSIKGSRDATVTSIRVYVEYPDEKTVVYNENEANTIEKWENTNITLNRTFTGSQWNTICLPFDLSKNELEGVFGGNTKLVAYDSESDNTVLFKTVTEKEENGKKSYFEAGKPYLIKPVNTVSTWTYKNMDVKVEAPETVGGNIKFQGLFSPKDITESGTVTAAGVTAGGNIVTAQTGSETKAFRAYFTFADATADPQAVKLMIDGSVTAIGSIDADTTTDANAPVYNIQGQRVDGASLTKGVYVKNGRKFVVTK